MKPGPKVIWPKLVEGHIYRYHMDAGPAHTPIERTWTVGPKTSMDSAARFRRATAAWTKRGWTVTVTDITAEAPQAPVEPAEAPEVTEVLFEPPAGLRGGLASRVGRLKYIEHGYAYVDGCPQALRPGFDIEHGAKVGDLIEYSYTQRSYGGGYYGKILK